MPAHPHPLQAPDMSWHRLLWGGQTRPSLSHAATVVVATAVVSLLDHRDRLQARYARRDRR